MKLRMGAISGALAMGLLSWAPMSFSFTPQSEMDMERDFTYQPATGMIAAVRQATAKYQDVAQAVHDGYVPVLGCVSGADQGAMGAHYLNPDLLDGALDVKHPELLVYEPVRGGRMQLVAVEYLTIAADWAAKHTDGSQPILMGQLFDYMDAPNRFGLPAFYSLHVWAWKFNPKGAFAMWNPHVSCTEYTGS